MRWASQLSVALVLAGCGRIGFDTEPDEVMISAGRITVSDFHSCAIDELDTLRCWGGSYAGEVGVGDYDVHLRPVEVSPQATWRSISSGTETTCGVQVDGSVWCWGSNGNGDLGLGDYDGRFLPAQVSVSGQMIAVTSANSDTNAIAADGTRWAWGDNRNTGALGVGNDVGPKPAPELALLDGWTTVAMGGDQACGLRSDRSLWCWGANGTYGLGLGDNVDRFSPTAVAVGTAWRAVSSGMNHACGIQLEGSLWCWGDNASGQLGDASLLRATTPTRVGTNTWVAVSCGEVSTCALDADAELWCWGTNSSGQLGLGDRSARKTPTAVAPGRRWREVDAAATEHACGIQVDGSVWCWGKGADGRLGVGDEQDRLVPTLAVPPQ